MHLLINIHVDKEPEYKDVVTDPDSRNENVSCNYVTTVRSSYDILNVQVFICMYVH